MEEKKRKPRGSGSRDKATVAIRREKVLALRAKGLAFRKIAAEVGAHYNTVRNDVKAALKTYAEDTAEHTELLRTLQNRRLDALQASLWDDATDPLIPVADRLPAVDRVLRIMERRAKLFGLDAEKKADVVENHQLAFVVIETREEAADFVSFRELRTLADNQEPG